MTQSSQGAKIVSSIQVGLPNFDRKITREGRSISRLCLSELLVDRLTALGVIEFKICHKN